MSNINSYIKDKFDISDKVLDFCAVAETQILELFKEIDEVAEINQYKVLSAMQKNKLSDMHFGTTTGYGYDDIGRDTLEEIYKDVFNTEDALVRPQIISGTHALTVALFGNLKYGDELLSIGTPYDTLVGVIGHDRETRGSLKEHGVSYKEMPLVNKDGVERVDLENIKNYINAKTKLVAIQRSRGYSDRPSLRISEIKEIIKIIKNIDKNIICMVDNCYGEFVEILEPSDVGADLVVGSLIKNIGGGLAPIGGYIVGKQEYVENCAFRLTAPGLGKEVGASLGINRDFIQGLFLAPTVVSSSLKGAIFCSRIFENLNIKVSPSSIEKRTDIVQSIQMEDPDKVIAFCQGIQKGAPVDSFVVPEPWDMPGYDCPVIMAAGAFIQGASIELSADAPIKPPYTVFMQGGLTWFHAKIGVMLAINEMYNKNLIKI